MQAKKSGKTKAKPETYEIIATNYEGIIVDSNSASNKTESIRIAKEMFKSEDVYFVKVINHVYCRYKD